MRVLKYQLMFGNPLILPITSKPIAVQEQKGNVNLWVIENSEEPRLGADEFFRVSAFGTGQIIPEQAGDYVKTIQTDNGDLVWHIFMKHPFRASF
jgi:hypothetical protein